MRILFLALLLSFFVAGEDIIPGKMSDVRGSGGAVLELTFRMGTPPRDVRMMADFSRSDIVMAQNPLLFSYSAEATSMGYVDLFHLGSMHLRLPFEYNPTLVGQLCPVCDGIIGTGGGSPLWVIWRSIYASVSGLRLQQDEMPHGATCKQPSPWFCETTGTLLGTAVDIIFDPSEPLTRIPVTLFNQLRDGRTVQDDWPAVNIYLDGTGDETSLKLHIPGDQVARHACGEPDVLTVDQQDIPDSVVTIGYEAMRAAAIRRDFNHGKLIFVPRITQRNATLLQSVTEVFLWLLFFYWKLVKPFFRIHQSLIRRHFYVIVSDIVFDFLVIVIPYTYWFQRGTFDALKYDPYMFITFGIVVLIATGWDVISVFSMLLRGPEHLGLFGADYVHARTKEGETAIKIDEFAHDPTSHRLDPGTRLRYARSTIVHQYARNTLVLVSIFMLNLSVAPDTLRGVQFFISGSFICFFTLMNLVLTLSFSLTNISFLWHTFIMCNILTTFGLQALIGIRVIAPLGELAHSYFELTEGLFIAGYFLVVICVIFYASAAQIVSFRMWITHAINHDKVDAQRS